MTTQINRNAPGHPRLGFRHWMERVLDEAKKVEQGFAPVPVHDLRVALRRCRSMADAFCAIDPDPVWRAMKRAGGRVFRSLGDLRDVQVMREWVRKLAPPGDGFEPSRDHALAQILDQALAQREAALQQDARTSLTRLDHEPWRKWAEHLAARAARVRMESPVFQYVALERWHEAHELHRRALRNRSKVGWHTLRVGIKRFRYTVENFLPERQERWCKDLKDLQDALGDVHDLDLLWEQIRVGGFEDHETVARWRRRIGEERGRRVEEYRRKTVGAGSLWLQWRAELPHGAEQHQALLAWAQTLVGFSSASVTHARHVTRLALQLHVGLLQAGVLSAAGADLKNALQLAAILQDIGRFYAKRGHHKRSYRMLGRMAVPLGWSAENWRVVAALARYHRGALPEAGRGGYGKIPARLRQSFLQLAAVLRLANALDAVHARTVRSIQVVRTAETITLLASGYIEDPAATPGIAIGRHLLETACGLPVVIRPVAIRRIDACAVGAEKLTVLKKRTTEAAGLQERRAVSIRRLALS